MKRFYLFTCIFILIDRITKILVENFLNNKVVDIIKNFFYLTYVKNEGAAFSLFTSSRIFLIIISLAAVILIYYYVNKYNKFNIGYALLLGGIIGNLIDRIVFGFVIDFIGVIIFNYNFPIFNVADIAIVLGAIFIIFEKERK